MSIKHKHTKIRLTLLLLLVIAAMQPERVKAQMSSNVNHINVSAGVLYQRGLDATVSFEHKTKYHNAWEFFVSGYIKWEKDAETGKVTHDSFFHSYCTYNAGITYKPCVIRGRNHHGNLRIGASVGSDTEDVIGIGHIGYEHTYALYSGWEVFWQLREDITIGGKDLLRTGVALGVKIPI